MQPVVDAPVAAHGLRRAFGIQTGGRDIIVCLAKHFAGSFDLGLNLDQAGRGRQPKLAGKATLA